MEYQMPNPKRIEVNCTTGEVLEIELTDEEVAQMEADRVIEEAQRAEVQAVEEAQVAAKLSAQNKLQALGLTDEEIAAITK
jgi:transcriptional antiterminator Rof (Rho-off)